MPDYGHPIRFGTFITPLHADPQRPVELAQLSERLGYDWVTIQDHPYQPRFYDTWTLLSFIAARTERIRLAPNVINLPLRPPAVLARAATSLGILSGGRFDLALGSGGFSEAARAMGAQERSAKEAVDALEEAIEVIHELWSDEKGVARYDGEFYRLNGAKRGPAPDPAIPIWLGARKPRMLRLIGAKGDGWVPSLPWLEAGDLARGNAIIDEAAAEAGRDPASITRLLNVGDQTAGQLLPFAVEDGVSVFIPMGDDPLFIERFAAEVAPALREAVAAERAL